MRISDWSTDVCSSDLTEPQVTRGSNHIRWAGPAQTVRLTTDAVPAYILGETWFLLDRPATLLFGADESLTESVVETGRVFFDNTVRYWRDWTRSLNIPFEWQDAVIRAAITLKLCTFEETGAVNDARSEERRVRKEGVRPGRSGWPPNH